MGNQRQMLETQRRAAKLALQDAAEAADVARSYGHNLLPATNQDALLWPIMARALTIKQSSTQMGL